MVESTPRHRKVADVIGVLPAHLEAAVVAGEANSEWRGVVSDSRKVEAGNLYCCIKGENFDGHQFASQAIELGAVALLVERLLLDVPKDVAQIQVTSVRDAIGFIASDAYDNPSLDMVIIGVTGTNGKTSTSHIIGGLLHGLGLNVAVYGTLTGERTTPEAVELQQQLAVARDSGVSHVIMEVSSHALALGRVRGTHFRAAVFTNLGHDHLDFHKTQEDYFAAKASLFRSEYCESAIINRDDPRGLIILDTTDLAAISFGESDVSNTIVTAKATKFQWNEVEICVPIGGAFTISNALAAVTVVKSLGYSPIQIVQACKNVMPVRGRFELVTGAQNFDVVVDYAHTPEGLEEVLKTARSLTRNSLTVVFGCGGDRDAAKRPAMGRVAANLADTVIITSDNPRNEDPSVIIDAIGNGAVGSRGNVLKIQDRREAIMHALQTASTGDIVIIAGKGHETTQEIKGVRTPFNDVEVAREILKNLEGDRT